jgi:hypothetical protein
MVWHGSRPLHLPGHRRRLDWRLLQARPERVGQDRVLLGRLLRDRGHGHHLHPRGRAAPRLQDAGEVAGQARQEPGGAARDGRGQEGGLQALGREVRHVHPPLHHRAARGSRGGCLHSRRLLLSTSDVCASPCGGWHNCGKRCWVSDIQVSTRDQSQARI